MSTVMVKRELDFTELGLIWYGGPLAIILARKNQLKLRKIQRMREFFINEFGIFETDSETEYRYGKQPISFYNSHDQSIPKKIVKSVKKNYQRGKFKEIIADLEQIYPEIKGLKFKTIFDVFAFIVKQTGHKAIDIDTEKYLPYYRAYNPISIKRLNEVCQNARKGVESLHPSFKPPMPIMILIIGGIMGMAIIQNGPKYMREISAYMEDLTSPAPVVEAVEEVPEIIAEVVANGTVVDTVGQFILFLSRLIV